MKFQEHVSLIPYTTFKLGGKARYFFEAVSQNEMIQAVRFADENSIPVYILGGGSNTVFIKEEFDGLVIRVATNGIFFEEKGDSVFITAQAGEEWDMFVGYTVANGWWGLENLSFIPGSVGAAPVQNIGAYGVEAGEKIHSVLVYDRKHDVVKTLTQTECLFGYRDSIFKKEEGRYIVLEVTFLLSKTPNRVLTYAGVSDLVEAEASLEEIRTAIIEIRKNKLPDWHTLPTAGSFFKNPIVSEHQAELLLFSYPKLPVYDAGEGKKKLSAGFLIEHIAGMKGESFGGVAVYEKHALVLINTGGGSPDELITLMQKIIKHIHHKTGVKLEPEVCLV